MKEKNNSSAMKMASLLPYYLKHFLRELDLPITDMTVYQLRFLALVDFNIHTEILSYILSVFLVNLEMFFLPFSMSSCLYSISQINIQL